MLRRISLAENGRLLYQIAETLRLRRGEMHLHRIKILLQILRCDCAAAFIRRVSKRGRYHTDLPRNWEDVISLSKKPRKRGLADSHTLRRGNFFESIDQFHVLGEVLLGVSRVELSNVAFLEVIRALDPAAEQPAGQGGIGDDSHTELTARGEELVLRRLDLGAESAVLHLHAGNRVDSMSAPQSCRRDLG